MWDVRETDPAKLIRSDMGEFGYHIGQSVQQVKRETHLAFLVSNDLQFGIARQFVMMAGWGEQEVRVTKSSQEAHDWLTIEFNSSYRGFE